MNTTMNMFRGVLREEANGEGVSSGGGVSVPSSAADNLLVDEKGQLSAWVTPDGELSEGWQARLGAGYDGLGKFKSVADMAKSYASLERMKGAPGEGAAPEEVARWDEMLGVPKDGTGYGLRAAVGVAEGEGWDEVLEEAVVKAARENHVPKAALQAIVKVQADYEREQAGRQAEVQARAIEEGRQALMGFWGGEYEKRIGMAKSALPALAQEFGLDLDGAEAQAALSSPFVVKLLHRVATLTASDSALGGSLPAGSGAAMSREDAVKVMTDPTHPQHAAYVRGDVDVCHAVDGAFGRKF